jgi:septum formation protein
MKIILASNSPRRRDLLWNAGFEFEVRPSKVQEAPRDGESPEDFACRAALEKALDVAAYSRRNSLVLGADTVVASDSTIFQKPKSFPEAELILAILSGSTHRVVTGVCLVRAPERIEAVKYETTLVTLRAMDRKEIRRYVRSGEPMDKAGAYGIQGLASRFVTRIEGSYFNVMGLPVHLVYEMLKPFLVRSPWWVVRKQRAAGDRQRTGFG